LDLGSVFNEFRLFEEILRWTRQSSRKLQLLSALPQSIQEQPLVAMGDLSISDAAMSDDLALSPFKKPVVPASRDAMGFGGFIYLLASAATQVSELFSAGSFRFYSCDLWYDRLFPTWIPLIVSLSSSSGCTKVEGQY
jgi:hypothetical protein